MPGYIRRSLKGFTIVELTVVIVIIGILAGITYVTYGNIHRDAADRAVQSDLEALAGIVTNYALKNGGTAKPWYSAEGEDADYRFSPSEGNVIDVAVNNDEFCIRGYSERANKRSVDDAFTKGSSEQACLLMDASVAAGGTGGAIQGWYKLNGNPADSSGQNRHGTVSGATPTTGQDGRASTAYNFSNTTSQWVNTGYNFPYDTLTVSIWAKPTGLSPNGYATLISNARDCCSTYNGFQIQYAKTSPYGVTSRLWWGTTAQSAMTYSGMQLNQWQHIVLTFDGTTSRMYYDGEEVMMREPPTSTLGASVYNVSIGKGGWSSGYSFGGDLDDARIYNYALSSAEVKQLFDQGAQ